MAIGYIKRLAGPYIGDGTGQKTFSFGFFVFTEGDVYVATAATENGASSNLQQGTDYTVTLNGDQEASPGYNQRMESRMMRSWGQGYWWGPRDTTPRRSPRMADAPD